VQWFWSSLQIKIGHKQEEICVDLAGGADLLRVLHMRAFLKTKEILQVERQEEKFGSSEKKQGGVIKEKYSKENQGERWPRILSPYSVSTLDVKRVVCLC
jgi:hypothetical protein